MTTSSAHPCATAEPALVAGSASLRHYAGVKDSDHERVRAARIFARRVAGAAHSCTRRLAVPALPRWRGAAADRQARGARTSDRRARRRRGHPVVLGRAGLAHACGDRMPRASVDGRRRRALEERLLRQRRATRRPPPARRRRCAALRPHACPVQSADAGAGSTTALGGDVPTVDALSAAQRRVLVALCRPYKGSPPFATPATNQEIATELVLSVEAIKTHLRLLFQKFGVEGFPQNQKRARLVERALLSGIVSERDL